MSFLEVSGVVRNEAATLAVNGVTFSQQASERLAVVGETGSGKSTLLRIIAGLTQPDAGLVTFREQRVKGPAEQLMPGHPRIAYLSQYFELRNKYRVEELLEMACLVPEAEAAHIYEVCRIRHLLRRWTDQLSGGERQRIALARLLTTAPALLILDEPFSNLDYAHKTELKEVLSSAGSRLGITFLLASHDPQDIMAWATRILVLKGGSLVAEGTPGDLYCRPSSRYVAGLFGKYTLVSYGAQPVMLRPEDIVLDPYPATQGSHQGVITAVRFQGFYQEVEVSIGGQLLTAFALRQEAYVPGSRVSIAIRRQLDVDASWL